MHGVGRRLHRGVRAKGSRARAREHVLHLSGEQARRRLGHERPVASMRTGDRERGGEELPDRLDPRHDAPDAWRHLTERSDDLAPGLAVLTTEFANHFSGGIQQHDGRKTFFIDAILLA